MLLCSDVHTHFTACQSAECCGTRGFCKKVSKKETFTVIISVQSEQTERKPSAVTGVVMVQIYMFILCRYFFYYCYQECSDAEGGGGQRRGQEEIIGWRLRSRGEALEWMGSEEIRHSG